MSRTAAGSLVIVALAGLAQAAAWGGPRIHVDGAASATARNAVVSPLVARRDGISGSVVAKPGRLLPALELRGVGPGPTPLRLDKSGRFSVTPSMVRVSAGQLTIGPVGSEEGFAIELGPIGGGGPAGWNASWVSGATQIRGEFQLDLAGGETVASATLHVTTPGAVMAYAWCEAAGGATLLSDDVGMPGTSTLPPHRLLYRSLAVNRSCLAAGTNVIGLRLGFARYGYLGMWCPGAHGTNASCRPALAQLDVTTSEGRSLVATSTAPGGASGWFGTTSASPLRFSHLYHGEVWDTTADDAWLDPAFRPKGSAGWAALDGWDDETLPLAMRGIDHHSMPPISPRSQAPVQPVSPPVAVAPGASGWWPQGDTSPSDRPAAPRGAAAFVFDLGTSYAVTAALRVDLGPPGSPWRAAAQGLMVAVRHSETLVSQVGNGSLPGLNESSPTPQFYPCTPVAAAAAGGALRSQGQHNCANMTLGIRLSGSPGRWGAVGPEDDEALAAGPGSVVVAPGMAWMVGRYVQVEGLSPGAGAASFRPSRVPSAGGGTFWLVGRPTHTALSSRDAAAPRLIAGPDASRGARLVAGTGAPGSGLLAAALQTQLNDVQSVPVDCANRERRGWGGDAQWTAGQASASLDMAAVYDNWAQTFADKQDAACVWPSDGAPPRGVPVCSAANMGPVPWPKPLDVAGMVAVFEPVAARLPGIDPTWTAVVVETLYQLWLQDGDTAVVERRFPVAAAHIAHFEAEADPALTLVRYGIFGDWAPPHGLRRPPTEIVSSFSHLLALHRGAHLATVVGNHSLAAEWTRRLHEAAPRWHARYWNATEGAYGLFVGRGRQLLEQEAAPHRRDDAASLGPPGPVARAPLLTPQALGVFLGRVLTNGTGMPRGAPAALEAAVEREGRSWMVGTVGSRYVLQALSAIGRDDLAVGMVAHEAPPGFAAMLADGPGTLWEHWLTGPRNATGGESLGHIMYAGGVGLYLRALSGAARRVPSGLGAAEWVLGPPGGAAKAWAAATAGVTRGASAGGSAAAASESPAGSVSVTWRVSREEGTVTASIAPGSAVSVLVPLPGMSGTRHRVCVHLDAAEGKTRCAVVPAGAPGAEVHLAPGWTVRVAGLGAHARIHGPPGDWRAVASALEGV